MVKRYALQWGAALAPWGGAGPSIGWGGKCSGVSLDHSAGRSHTGCGAAAGASACRVQQQRGHREVWSGCNDGDLLGAQ